MAAKTSVRFSHIVASRLQLPAKRFPLPLRYQVFPTNSAIRQWRESEVPNRRRVETITLILLMSGNDLKQSRPALSIAGRAECKSAAKFERKGVKPLEALGLCWCKFRFGVENFADFPDEGGGSKRFVKERLVCDDDAVADHGVVSVAAHKEDAKAREL